ncbi:hypothetical protein AbraIFM66951_001321 [Aspergillus brasiliensis]|nr:hypothetical protein AbraIFM66951_001321 [Aspergillus brasiliensis]
MAQPTIVQIRCSAPDESQLALQAGFEGGLGVNILTPKGRQILDVVPRSQGRKRDLQLTSGDVVTVCDYVSLHFWLDGTTRSNEEDFYIPVDEKILGILGLPDVHVILGRNCFLTIEELSTNDSFMAPIQLGPLPKDKEKMMMDALIAKIKKAKEDEEKQLES